MSENSRSHLYGSGVFTTIRIIDGKPWLWEKHWRRLIHDGNRLGLDLSDITEEFCRKELDYALQVDELLNGRARISWHDRRASALWPGVDTSDQLTTISIVTGESREVTRPFRLTISPHLINSTSPIAGLKTCNYLGQTMALYEARSRGFTEAIRVNERGYITSACMANVFWLKGDKMFTPSLATGCLPGTTREFVMDNLAVQEVEARITELQSADAIFLTSAGLGVVAVDEFDGRVLASQAHPILDLVPR